MNLNGLSPEDMAAVLADDALLDALGSEPTPTDHDVGRVLAAWRDEVDTEPLPSLVDADTALALVCGPRRPGRWRVVFAAARRIAGCLPSLPRKDRP